MAKHTKRRAKDKKQFNKRKHIHIKSNDRITNKERINLKTHIDKNVERSWQKPEQKPLSKLENKKLYQK